MKLRNLMVLTIMVFGISVLATAEETKVEWEYIKGGQSKAVIKDASYDEVWEKVMDVLLFEKFKVKGQILNVRHNTVTMEKTTGLFVVNGLMGGHPTYVLKITIYEKDDQIVMKTRCSSSWKKRVTKTFYQLLEKALNNEEEK